MKKLSNPIEAQKWILLNFMEKHPVLAKGGKLNPEEKKRRHLLWQKLAAELNSCSGPKRSIFQWRKVWIDMINFRKRKMVTKKMAFSNFDIRLMKFVTQQPTQDLEMGDASDNVNWHFSTESVTKQDDPFTSEDQAEGSTMLLKQEVGEKVTGEPLTELTGSPSSVPSHHSSSRLINPEKRNEHNEEFSDKLLETVTQTIGGFNKHMSTLTTTLNELLEERRNTNVLLTELIQVLKNR